MKFLSPIVYSRAAGFIAAACATTFARADAPPKRYVVAADVVRDTKTGLVWQRQMATGLYTWEQAGAYCKALNLNGGMWRLPRMKELVTILDYTRSNPAIDLNAFPGTPADRFWTASPLVRQPNSYWNVDFTDGETYNCTCANNGNTFYVRCVSDDVNL